MRAEPTYATRRSPQRYSDGPIVGAAIEKWQGRKPKRWQQEQLDVALERVDGPGSPFAYDEVIVIVGRRCGKTVMSFGVPLARALAGPIALPNGRVLPFRSVHIAQNVNEAEQRFANDMVRPFERKFSPAGWKTAVRDLGGHGTTRLILDPRKRRSITQAERRGIASELRVLAPVANAARGSGVFHRTYDEALTFPYDVGRRLEDAGRPTMSELQGHAQTWRVSNISRDTGPLMHLWHQRERGREAVLAERRDGICYTEFSLPKDADPDDEAEWWRHYPALGDEIVGIAQMRRDKEVLRDRAGSFAGFYAEYLGRWSDETETGLMGWTVISVEDLTGAGLDAEETAPGVEAALGVDIDPDSRAASIFAVTDDTAGELIDHRAGTDWVRDRLLELAQSPDVTAIALDDYGPGHGLIDALRGTVVEPKLVITRGQDLIAACFSFDERLKAHTITWRHNEHDQALLEAAAAAEHTTGRAWQYNRRLPAPQTPLFAWLLALWAYRHRPEQLPDSQIF